MEVGLVTYDSSDSDSSQSGASTNAESTSNAIILPLCVQSSSSLVKSTELAPLVDVKATALDFHPIDPTLRELDYNPTVDEMYAPDIGPSNPYRLERQNRNMLTGHVEATNMHSFDFDNQWRTFQKYGYASDPSSNSLGALIGNTDLALENNGLTAFETSNSQEKPVTKRKRAANYNPEDLDGFTGPWAKFVDEQTTAQPAEGEEAQYMMDYIAKKALNRKKRTADRFGQTGELAHDEKSVLHVPSIKDYQGKSYLQPPQDTGVNFRADDPPNKCYAPKRLLHEWNNAHSRGVSTIRLFPKTGHLLVSAGMDTKIKLWEMYNTRRLLRSFIGHQQAVKDVCFNADGSQFLSCSYDRSIKLWNTETGQCEQRFVPKRIAHCIKFNPDADKQHLFLAGCADKRIYCYDTRSAEVVQHYDRHMGAVNSVTFFDGNRRFVSTADDKSLRVWEWDIPVDFICLADPSMHSMPATTLSPNGKWLVCQSLDNQLITFNALASFKRARKKCFRGHLVSGYACEPAFSPDMSYLTSGDGNGRIFIWDFRTTRQVAKWQAHEKCCISVDWLPHETSKIVSCGWDGHIKIWD